MNSLKIVVADIDGTLVNTARVMTPLTSRVLNDLHKKGVLFGIASGRPIGDHMRERPKNWNLDFYPDFIIGMNGGQLEDTIEGTYQEFYKLPGEVIREIVDMMEAFPNIYPFKYVGEDYMVIKDNEGQRKSAAKNKVNLLIAEDKEEFCAESSANVLFRLASEDLMPAVEAFVAEHPSDRYIGYKTQSWLVEFNDARVNKGVAVKKYCEDKGISLEDVISFGDTTNDNEMLKVTGMSACLKNGTDDTKACAKVVTEYTNDEDGVGRYLLDHIYPKYGWTFEE